MALHVSGVFEVNNTGNDRNGGGVNRFNVGFNTDLTYPTSQPTLFSACLNSAGSTTLTTQGPAIFTNAMSGNYIHIQPMSGFFEIATVSSSSTVTLDRTAGTFTGWTGTVGGALASPGAASSGMIGGNTMWVRNAPGWYAMAFATANTPSGMVSLPAGTAAASTRMIGYNTTRGDINDLSLNMPYLQVSGTVSTFTMVLTAANCEVKNLILDGALKTSSRAAFSQNGSRLYNLFAKNCTNNAIAGGAAGSTVSCATSGCTISPTFNGGFYMDCAAVGNNAAGFGGGIHMFCISIFNTGATVDGFLNNSISMICMKCEAYYNGRDGFRYVPSTSLALKAVDCYAEGHVAGTSNGFNTTANSDVVFLTHCAAFNNTTNFSPNFSSGTLHSTFELTASPAVGATPDQNNFLRSPNSQLIGRGSLGIFPSFLLTASSVSDIGALRSSCPAIQLFRYGTMAGGFGE